MEIAIIGTGNVGGALARALTKARHSVVVTSTTLGEAVALAREVGGRAVGSNREAAEDGEVIIPAVYWVSLPAVLEEIADAVDGKIVVDVTNRAAGNPGVVVDGTSNAETVQERLPNARVVKAFNTAFASRQVDPNVNGVPVDGFVAASDEGAKKIVLDLVREIGFNPVDAGPLESARILEAMAALNVWRNMQGGTWQSAWKIVEPAA
jgi:predicted dinucleotide-binding enzyme